MLWEQFHYARSQCVIGSKSFFHLKVPFVALLLNQNDPIIDNLSCQKIFLDSLVFFYLEGFYEVLLKVLLKSHYSSSGLRSYNYIFRMNIISRLGIIVYNI